MKHHIGQLDKLLLIIPIICAAFGFILIYSATRSYGNNRTLIVQAAAICIGFAGMLILSKFDYEHLAEMWKIVFLINILLLLWVLFFGTGASEWGNNSWIRFMGIGIQPSELVKIGFTITFATHLSNVKSSINSPKTLLLLAVHFGIIAVFIQKQGDLGTLLVFLFMAACMCLCAGLNIWYYGGAAIAGLLASPFIWNALKPYQQGRILAVMYPEIDPLGYAFQATQCKTAIGSGGIFGRGYLQGTMTQNEFIPAKHTDCIFAVAGEELGMIACLLIIILLIVIILRCFYISTVARCDIGSIMCIGIGSMILFQTIINVGMCIGIFPVIGITLPFYSYGGSSVMSGFIALGLVQSVYTRRKVINFGE